MSAHQRQHPYLLVVGASNESSYEIILSDVVHKPLWHPVTGKEQRWISHGSPKSYSSPIMPLDLQVMSPKQIEGTVALAGPLKACLMDKEGHRKVCKSSAPGVEGGAQESRLGGTHFLLRLPKRSFFSNVSSLM